MKALAKTIIGSHVDVCVFYFAPLSQSLGAMTLLDLCKCRIWPKSGLRLEGCVILLIRSFLPFLSFFSLSACAHSDYHSNPTV